MAGKRAGQLYRVLRDTAGAAALLALASCGGSPRQRVAPPPPPRAIAAVPLSAEASAALSSPQGFMTLAASQALFSIQASEIAVSRVSSSRLRAVADDVARDQLAISAQLTFAGRRLDLLPSAALEPRHRAMLDELRGAARFDSVYKRQMTEVLGDAYALHRAYAERGSSPTLRPVSAMAAPILGREVNALRKL